MKIYVISIHGSMRRKNIVKNFEKYSIDFEFFDAVDGRKLSDSQIKDLYDDNKAKQLAFKLTRAQVGCALSHKALYQKMVSENIPEMLVFEDDVFIDENIELFLNTYKNFKPKNVDIILLGSVCRKFLRTQKFFSWLMLKKLPFKVNNTTCRMGKSYASSGGAYAYYITKQGAQKMIDLNSPKVCYVADMITGDIIVSGHNLYVIFPNIVGLQDVDSEIGVDYNIYIKSNKLKFSKFCRMLMIKSNFFLNFMINYKTKKLHKIKK